MKHFHTIGPMAAMFVAISVPASVTRAQTPPASRYLNSFAQCEVGTQLRDGTLSGLRASFAIMAKSEGIDQAISGARLKANDCYDRLEEALVAFPADKRAENGIPAAAIVKSDVARSRAAAMAGIGDFASSTAFKAYLDGPEAGAAYGKRMLGGRSYMAIYRDEVEKCDYAAAQAGHPDRELYIRQGLKRQDREITVTVERLIGDGATAMTACIDKVAGAMHAVPASAVPAEEYAAVDADLLQRKTGATVAVRGYFTSLGYRPSSGKRKAEPGYFFCVLGYQEIVGGKWTELNGNVKSRIVADPDLGAAFDRGKFRATQRAVVDGLKAFVRQSALQLQGKPINGMSLEDTDCYDKATRAEAVAEFADRSGYAAAYP